jgi:Na+-transporting NADH:ubiquinone oxidoreductase subunit F
MTTLLFGALAFTLVTLVLVSILLGARALLVPSGPVRIEINEGGVNDVATRAGHTLLDTLATSGIFLPSACGGRGTCGVCRVRVRGGGDGLLPTEAAHIGRAEALEGWRLACQVKVKTDCKIDVPPEIFAARKLTCRVRSNRNVSTFIREVVLELPAGEQFEFRAGSYIQVDCPPFEVSFADFEVDERFRADWDRYGLWRLEARSDETATRAYSLANCPGEPGILTLNVRIATPPPEARDVPPGVASSWLFSLASGDPVTVSGPFGDFLACDTDREMIFVGGGAGMAPLRSIILDQLERIGTSRKISFWYGARSLQEAFYVEEFDRLEREYDNFGWHLALSAPLAEDRWTGHTGFIHQVLFDEYLARHPAPESAEYYLCGPPAMVQACRKTLFDIGVDPQDVMFDDFGG